MSTKYKRSKDIPLSTLANRLDELGTAVAEGRINETFIMRVPAELDYDPDLVMSEASVRLQKLMDSQKALKFTIDKFLRYYDDEENRRTVLKLKQLVMEV